MKKRFLLLSFLITIPQLLLSNHDYFNYCYDGNYLHNKLCDHEDYKINKSFMLTRPVSQNYTMNQSIWHDYIYNRKGKMHASFQMIAVYQDSFKDKKTAEYFTFNCKSALTVLGDDTTDAKFRDIRAEWLGLPSEFRGVVGVCPQQRQAGLIIEYNQSLENVFDIDFLKRYYVSVIVPLIAVENSMNIQQFDVLNGEGKDLIQAFNNPEWKYARINGKYSKFRAAPIKLRFGGAFMSEGSTQIANFTTILIPTDGKASGCYLFEPNVGYNGHLGIASGVNFQFGLNKNNERYDVCFFLNVEAIFLIRNTQYRTFDLKGKPWSRYLLFKEEDGHPSETYPGVNILTQKVRVRPYNIVDLSAGWRIKTECAEFEVGYNIWGHGDERIECVKRFCRKWGIAGEQQEDDTKTRSASLSTFEIQKATAQEEADQDTEDFKFVPIDVCDLDLCSASSQGALNHRVHLAMGYGSKGNTVDAFFGLGGYYEIAQKNSALKTWGLWLKLGGSF